MDTVWGSIPWGATGGIMDKVCVLIASGPNSVAVPCRIFRSQEDGKAFMVQNFGLPKRWDKAERKLVEDPNGWSWPMERDDEEKLKALFEFYYDGCGEVGALHLKSVAFDSVFVGWDLD